LEQTLERPLPETQTSRHGALDGDDGLRFGSYVAGKFWGNWGGARWEVYGASWFLLSRRSLKLIDIWRDMWAVWFIRWINVCISRS